MNTNVNRIRSSTLVNNNAALNTNQNSGIGGIQSSSSSITAEMIKNMQQQQLFRIHSAANQELALTANGGKTEKGTPIKLRKI